MLMLVLVGVVVVAEVQNIEAEMQQYVRHASESHATHNGGAALCERGLWEEPRV